ncbi:MAG TPA: hypothetical protein VGL63_11575 [Streptosporangiaceae bacterium]|jgi:hypothetical protein
MRYRVTFAAGLAAGFVIGARAGRERYEQMKKLARRAADNPAVQQAAGAAAAQATGLAKAAKDRAVDQIQQRAPGLGDAAKRTGERIQERIPPRWRASDTGEGVASGDGVPSVPGSGEAFDGG